METICKFALGYSFFFLFIIIIILNKRDPVSQLKLCFEAVLSEGRKKLFTATLPGILKFEPDLNNFRMK